MSTAEVIDFQTASIGDLEPSQAVRVLVDQAAELHASDIFFLSDENGLRVAIRRMGRLENLAELSREQGRYLISYLKAQAGIDIAERRRPQEGRWIFEREEGRIDLRINIIPTLHGEDLAARILDRKQGLRTLESLGLTKGDYQKLTSLLASPSGLILVTGPTGTGKTTTLYACLQHLNNGSRKINTLEDPVEYQLAGIRQSQVSTKLAVDFPEMLRNVLRQAPDVIMIGEIRDEETAATAVRAANSGHLVLATLHAPVAAGAVPSIAIPSSSPVASWGSSPSAWCGSSARTAAQRMTSANRRIRSQRSRRCSSPAWGLSSTAPVAATSAATRVTAGRSACSS
jgi:type II secretory ATPase GspE/PulE/Tfp pilus assembly ATPase PilB-like protein